jgi:hypothetical protein
VKVPAGTPVTLEVIGNNLQTLLGRTNSSGQAAFSYVGTFAGNDVVAATATVGSQRLVSNTTLVTWGLGLHSAFLTLNLSPKTAVPGEPVTMMVHSSMYRRIRRFQSSTSRSRWRWATIPASLRPTRMATQAAKSTQ